MVKVSEARANRARLQQLFELLQQYRQEKSNTVFAQMTGIVEAMTTEERDTLWRALGYLLPSDRKARTYTALVAVPCGCLVLIGGFVLLDHYYNAPTVMASVLGANVLCMVVMYACLKMPFLMNQWRSSIDMFLLHDSKNIHILFRLFQRRAYLSRLVETRSLHSAGYIRAAVNDQIIALLHPEYDTDPRASDETIQLLCTILTGEESSGGNSELRKAVCDFLVRCGYKTEPEVLELSR